MLTLLAVGTTLRIGSQYQRRIRVMGGTLWTAGQGRTWKVLTYRHEGGNLEHYLEATPTVAHCKRPATQRNLKSSTELQLQIIRN